MQAAEQIGGIMKRKSAKVKSKPIDTSHFEKTYIEINGEKIEVESLTVTVGGVEVKPVHGGLFNII